jgi:MerR family transcriptional regulator/heat shock protein HspR
MEDGTRTEEPRWSERGIRFTISIAAELINVHAQTLRHYERIGLIAPKRSEGKIRYYTPEDIDRLTLITSLIEQRKVNLAGVQAILELQEQMAEMRAEHERHIEETRARYDGEVARLKGIIRRMNGQESAREQEPLPSH